MELRVSDCLKETGYRLNFDEVCKLLFKDEELGQLGPVHFSGTVIGLGMDKVLAAVSAESFITLVCGRCSKPFTYSFAVDFEEVFSADPELDQFSENPSLPIVDGCRIYLDEAFRQNVLGVLPMAAVCDSNCPVPEAPQQRQKEIDPRWEKLVELKTMLPDKISRSQK